MPTIIRVIWCPVCDGSHHDRKTGRMVTHGDAPSHPIVHDYRCKCTRTGFLFEAKFEGAPA